VIVYLSVAQLLELHRMQIAKYGGLTGLRDRGLLEAAAARPAMTFAGEDLYPDVAAKTAALMHSLVLNHPFIDGNKRVAAHAAVLFALLNGVESTATPDELAAVTIRAAEGQLSPEALAIWWRQYSTSTDDDGRR
jgi:death-on-curing protein